MIAYPPPVVGTLDTPVGNVPWVTAELSGADRLARWKARWTIGRMRMAIPPGLYALGMPMAESPVLVSANYRLSFDTLRSSVPGLNAWILVLDTKGINVWCAAGKGTFGTDELVRRVGAVRLAEVVSHRTLILPQLGAPGVAAHRVKAGCGFRVVYGPVRARDIPRFLQDGMKASPEARRVQFPLADRVRLIPAELMPVTKWALLISVFFLLASGLGRDGYALGRLSTVGIPSLVFVLLSIIAAAILTPPLLPWLPGRAFALKGMWIGLAAAVLVVLYSSGHPALWHQWPGTIGWLLALPAITSFIAMNFTGASTYTCLSGVLKEMRIAVPLQIAGAVTGVLFWLGGRFVRG